MKDAKEEALTRFRLALGDLLAAMITERGEVQAKAIVAAFARGATLELSTDIKQSGLKVYCAISDGKSVNDLFEIEDRTALVLAIPDLTRQAS